MTQLQISRGVWDWILGKGRAMRNCEFLGLLGSRPHSSIVTVALTLPCVTASTTHAQVSGSAVREGLSWFESQGWQCAGMVHGHSSFATYHSETDNQSIHGWLPRIAELNRSFCGDMGPRVLGPSSAFLPANCGDGIRFDLAATSELRSMCWKSVHITTCSTALANKCFSQPSQLLLEGGNVRIVFGLPENAVLSQRVERMPGTVGTAYSLVVNSRSEHFCESLHVVDINTSQILQKSPCEIDVVEAGQEGAVVNRDYLCFAEVNVATAFGQRSGTQVLSFSGQELGHE